MKSLPSTVVVQFIFFLIITAQHRLQIIGRPHPPTHGLVDGFPIGLHQEAARTAPHIGGQSKQQEAPSPQISQRSQSQKSKHSHQGGVSRTPNVLEDELGVFPAVQDGKAPKKPVRPSVKYSSAVATPSIQPVDETLQKDRDDFTSLGAEDRSAIPHSEESLVEKHFTESVHPEETPQFAKATHRQPRILTTGAPSSQKGKSASAQDARKHSSESSRKGHNKSAALVAEQGARPPPHRQAGSVIAPVLLPPIAHQHPAILKFESRQPPLGQIKPPARRSATKQQQQQQNLPSASVGSESQIETAPQFYVVPIKRSILRAGLLMIPGQKSLRRGDLNEDIGDIDDLFVLQLTPGPPKYNFNVNSGGGTIGSEGEQIAKRFSERPITARASVAYVFDGHGAKLLANRSPAGRLVSHCTLAVFKQILRQKLPAILSAPLLKESDPDFFTKSKQSLFSGTFLQTSHAVKELLPDPVTFLAGTTATVILALHDHPPSLGPDGGLNIKSHKGGSGVTLLSANLGDSRAIAITFKRIISGSPGSQVFTYKAMWQTLLTEEHNIREAHQIIEVSQKLEHMGFKAMHVAPSNSPRRSGRRSRRERPPPTVFVHPEDWEAIAGPSHAVWNLDQVREVVEHSQQQQHRLEVGAKRFKLFSIEQPYLMVYPNEVFRTGNNLMGGQFAFKKRAGLQLTASIGDRFLEPIKKSTRTPAQVQVRHLTPAQDTVTIVLVASDGLWEPVDRKFHKMDNFNRYLGTVIGSIDTRWMGAKEEVVIRVRLLRYLRSWAPRKTRDDITIAILPFANLSLNPSSGGTAGGVP